jgi:hypothetical protein
MVAPYINFDPKNALKYKKRRIRRRSIVPMRRIRRIRRDE